MRLSPPGEHWTWRAPAPQPRSDENSDHESQMSEKGEEGKWQIDCVNRAVCVSFHDGKGGHSQSKQG